MAGTIRFFLSNFTLTLLLIGVIASAIALLRAPKPLTAPVVVEALFRWFLFFSIGVSYFYNFVMHTFFGEMAAKFIGWADSPFQLEVGFASLGFAVIGFLAFLALQKSVQGRSSSATRHATSISLDSRSVFLAKVSRMPVSSCVYAALIELILQELNGCVTGYIVPAIAGARRDLQQRAANCRRYG